MHRSHVLQDKTLDIIRNHDGPVAAFFDAILFSPWLHYLKEVGLNRYAVCSKTNSEAQLTVESGAKRRCELMEKVFAVKLFLAKELFMTSLRRRMTEDMQVRNLSSQTQATYVQQVSLFARHFNKSPEILGPEEIRSYQVYLTNEKKLAPSSIIIAVAALRFLYKITLRKDWCLEEVIPTPKKPQKLPIVLSPEEVLQFLGTARGIKHRTILTTCYAAGLGVSEAICLQVTDVDSQRMAIRVEQGKGRKIAMSCSPQSCSKPCATGGE